MSEESKFDPVVIATPEDIKERLSGVMGYLGNAQTLYRGPYIKYDSKPVALTKKQVEEIKERLGLLPENHGEGIW